MAKKSDAERLAELEARLDAARATEQPEPKMGEHYSQAQMAWRMVIELVAGLAIGFGIGYGLDLLLGSQPFLMVIFTLLGFIAGVKTMIRSAREMAEPSKEGDERGERSEHER